MFVGIPTSYVKEKKYFSKIIHESLPPFNNLPLWWLSHYALLENYFSIALYFRFIVSLMLDFSFRFQLISLNYFIIPMTRTVKHGTT